MTDVKLNMSLWRVKHRANQISTQIYVVIVVQLVIRITVMDIKSILFCVEINGVEINFISNPVLYYTYLVS